MKGKLMKTREVLYNIVIGSLALVLVVDYFSLAPSVSAQGDNADRIALAICDNPNEVVYQNGDNYELESTVDGGTLQILAPVQYGVVDVQCVEVVNYPGASLIITFVDRSAHWHDGELIESYPGVKLYVGSEGNLQAWSHDATTITVTTVVGEGLSGTYGPSYYLREGDEIVDFWLLGRNRLVRICNPSVGGCHLYYHHWTARYFVGWDIVSVESSIHSLELSSGIVGHITIVARDPLTGDNFIVVIDSGGGWTFRLIGFEAREAIFFDRGYVVILGINGEIVVMHTVSTSYGTLTFEGGIDIAEYDGFIVVLFQDGTTRSLVRLMIEASD